MVALRKKLAEVTEEREIRHLHGDWRTLTGSQLRTILFDYIDSF